MAELDNQMNDYSDNILRNEETIKAQKSIENSIQKSIKYMLKKKDGSTSKQSSFTSNQLNEIVNIDILSGENGGTTTTLGSTHHNLLFDNPLQTKTIPANHKRYVDDQQSQMVYIPPRKIIQQQQYKIINESERNSDRLNKNFDNIFKNSPLKKKEEEFQQITDREHYLSCEDDTYEDNFENNKNLVNNIFQQKANQNIDKQQNQDYDSSLEQQEIQIHRRKQQRHQKQQNNQQKPFLVQINLQDLDSKKDFNEVEDYTFGNLRSYADSGIGISASFGKQEKDMMISQLGHIKNIKNKNLDQRLNQQQFEKNLKQKKKKEIQQFMKSNFENEYTDQDLEIERNNPFHKVLNQTEYKKNNSRVSQPLPHKIQEYKEDFQIKQKYSSLAKDNISSENSIQQKQRSSIQQPGVFDAVSQFITKFWGKEEEESKSNQLDSIEIYEIENEEGIYQMIDENRVAPSVKRVDQNQEQYTTKRENSSEDTRVQQEELMQVLQINRVPTKFDSTHFQEDLQFRSNKAAASSFNMTLQEMIQFHKNENLKKMQNEHENQNVALPQKLKEKQNNNYSKITPRLELENNQLNQKQQYLIQKNQEQFNKIENPTNYASIYYKIKDENKDEQNERLRIGKIPQTKPKQQQESIILNPTQSDFIHSKQLKQQYNHPNQTIQKRGIRSLTNYSEPNHYQS